MRKKILITFASIICLIIIGVLVFKNYGISWETELELSEESTVYYVIDNTDLLVNNGYKEDGLFFGHKTRLGNPMIAIIFLTNESMTNKIEWQLSFSPFYKSKTFDGIPGMAGCTECRFMIDSSVYLSNACLNLTYYTNRPIDGINEMKEHINMLLQSNYIGLK